MSAKNDPNQCNWKDCPIADQIDRIEQDCAEIRKVLLTGNGQPGLITRVDRLEQDSGRRGTYLKLVLGVALSGLLGLIGVGLKLFWGAIHGG